MIARATGHLLQAALTVVLAVAGMQLLLLAAPGDPIDLLPNADQVRDVLQAQWGLDRALHERILATLTGDLGVSLSLRPGQPVWELVHRPLLRTGLLWLSGGTLLAALATLGAVSRRRLPRAAVWSLGALGTVPVFLLAHLAVGGFNDAAVALGDAGRHGWFPLPLNPSPLRTALAIAVLAIGSAALSDAYGSLRQRVDQLRDSPFALAAASRGESEWSWLWRHLGVAIAELVATRGPALLGALVIAEKVLLLRGAGSVLWDAAVARDYPVALGLTAVFALSVALLRAGTDIAADALSRGQADT